MRGFFIMFIAFVLVLAFVITEEFYVRHTTKELLSILEDVSTVNDFETVLKAWEKKEKVLSWFINHKELERITVELRAAESYLKENEQNLYKAHISRSKVRIGNLPNY